MTAVQLLCLAEQFRLEGLRRLREPDTVRADLGEEAKLGRPEPQRPPRLGRQGYSFQLGLLYAQECPVRRVLALLPPSLDGVRCRRPRAGVQLLGRP